MSSDAAPACVEPLRTTLSAPVLPASANVSYALIVSPIANRWVANSDGSRRPLDDQPHQLRDAERVDQPGRDGHVADPQLLQVQRGGLAVDADVRESAARADQLGGELERRRNADRLERAVGAETISQLHDLRDRVIATVVDRHVGAESPGALETAVGEIDRDDPTGV